MQVSWRKVAVVVVLSLLISAVGPLAAAGNAQSVFSYMLSEAEMRTIVGGWAEPKPDDPTPQPVPLDVWEYRDTLRTTSPPTEVLLDSWAFVNHGVMPLLYNGFEYTITYSNTLTVGGSMAAGAGFGFASTKAFAEFELGRSDESGCVKTMKFFHPPFWLDPSGFNIIRIYQMKEVRQAERQAWRKYSDGSWQRDPAHDVIARREISSNHRVDQYAVMMRYAL